MSFWTNSTSDKKRLRRSSASASIQTLSIFTSAGEADDDTPDWSPSTGSFKQELGYKAIDGGGVCPAARVHPIALDGEPLPAIVAIIDSGADWSTFPEEYAARLGIDLERDCVPQDARTAGGVTKNYRYKPGIEIMLKDERLKIAANFCRDLKVPVLGRKDFFAAYKVTVDERARVVVLEPYR